MKGLLYKDFKLCGKYILFLLGTGLICLSVIQFKITGFHKAMDILGAMFLINSYIAPLILFQDFNASFSKFGLALPTSYAEFVLSKYIQIWGIGVINLIEFIFFLYIIIQETFSLQILLFTLIIFSVQTIINSICLPFIFKVKDKIANLFFSPLYITATIPAFFGRFIFSPVINFITKIKLNISLIFAIILGITILINGLSFLISVKIIKNKEV